MSNSPGVGHILSIIISVISLVATIATQCNKKPITYKPLETSLFRYEEERNVGNFRGSDSLRLFAVLSEEPYLSLVPPKNKPRLQKLLKGKNFNDYSFEQQDDSTAVEKGKIDDAYSVEITQTVYNNRINYVFKMTSEKEILNIDKFDDWYRLLGQFIAEIEKRQAKQTRISFANAYIAIQQHKRHATGFHTQQLPVNFEDGQISLLRISTEGQHSSIDFALFVPAN